MQIKNAAMVFRGLNPEERIRNYMSIRKSLGKLKLIKEKEFF